MAVPLKSFLSRRCVRTATQVLPRGGCWLPTQSHKLGDDRSIRFLATVSKFRVSVVEFPVMVRTQRNHVVQAVYLCQGPLFRERGNRPSVANLGIFFIAANDASRPLAGRNKHLCGVDANSVTGRLPSAAI